MIAYIARANVALSVTMTACSTLLSPLATPTAMKLIAGQYVPIEFVRNDGWILKMILLPVLLGLLANRYARRLVERFTRVLAGGGHVLDLRDHRHHDCLGTG